MKPLTVGVVGSGRVGTAIARALTACGHNVVAVVARQTKHASRAASLIGARAHALTISQLDALPPVDLLFITTPDDAITETAARLAAIRRTDGSNRPVALHMSGATSSDALAPLRECGLHIGSMHPLASVSEPMSGAENLRSAFYCLEGDRKAVSTARRLVRELGGKSFSIKTSDKALYHAAAVISCNHLVALFDLAVELITRCSISKSDALSILIPLLRNTCENIAARGTQHALTGPFIRADVATVRRHLSALAAQNSSEPMAVYTLLGRRSLRLAQAGGADVARLREIALELDRADGKK
jgi:predicted short-subunit dehydrogenase-like oxidoreductase (DUF2520 family)